MTKRSIVVPVVLFLALSLAACGESNGGGSAGMNGTGGTAGTGGIADDDCSRICESACVEEVIPVGMVDDCILSCRMGFFTCIPQLIAVLECIELVSCDILADPCTTQSEALTTCLAGGG